MDCIIILQRCFPVWANRSNHQHQRFRFHVPGSLRATQRKGGFCFCQDCCDSLVMSLQATLNLSGSGLDHRHAGVWHQWHFPREKLNQFCWSWHVRLHSSECQREDVLSQLQTHGKEPRSMCVSQISSKNRSSQSPRTVGESFSSI